MKYIITLLVLLVFQISLYAHEGGHGNRKTWIIDNKPVQAEFLKYEEGKVFFLNDNHNLISYDLESLSSEQQKIILNKNAKVSSIHNKKETSNHYSYAFPGIGGILLILSIIFFINRGKNII